MVAKERVGEYDAPGAPMKDKSKMLTYTMFEI